MKHLLLFEQLTPRLVVYHGSYAADIEAFKIGAVGRETDQEGPGIYFSDLLSDAEHYGTTVYEVALTPRNLVGRRKFASRAAVREMLNMAPDLEDTLTNWDENPTRAMRNALDAMMDYDTEVEVYQSVWYDFYRDHPEAFIKNMVLNGFDGMVVDKFHGSKHYIMYNPQCIRILKKMDAKDE